MKKTTMCGILATGLVFALGMTGICATKKKAPVKKPVAKTQHYVQGTTQLKGEYAELGNVYTLGKECPFNIKLINAEYTLDAVRIGDNTYIPGKDEKLMVLHMTYHNPQHSEYFVRWDTLEFTAVDAHDQNHEGLKDLGMEKDKSTCSMNFKPAQKVNVYGVMVVPAAGEIPKLIVKSSDNLVLRYNLKGKVKPLAAPFADPADKTGATALEDIPAQMNTYYPLGALNVKLENVAYNDSAQMGEIELEENEKFLVAQIQVKNVSASEQFLRWDTFDPVITDTDGAEVANCADMLYKSKDTSFSTNLKPAQELTVRCIFKVPNDTDVKTLSMYLDAGHTFLFDISNVK